MRDDERGSGDGPRTLGRMTGPDAGTNENKPTTERGGAASLRERLEHVGRMSPEASKLAFGLPEPASLDEAVRAVAEQRTPTCSRWICEPRMTVHLSQEGWRVTLARWGVATAISRELASMLVGEAYARALPKRDGLHPWTIAREGELAALEAACRDCGAVEGVVRGRTLRQVVRR